MAFLHGQSGSSKKGELAYEGAVWEWANPAANDYEEYITSTIDPPVDILEAFASGICYRSTNANTEFRISIYASENDGTTWDLLATATVTSTAAYSQLICSYVRDTDETRRFNKIKYYCFQASPYYMKSVSGCVLI